MVLGEENSEVDPIHIHYLVDGMFLSVSSYAQVQVIASSKSKQGFVLFFPFLSNAFRALG